MRLISNQEFTIGTIADNHKNLISFIKAGLKKEEGYLDCERLMLRQLRINFNFTKEEVFDDELIMTWMNKLSEGRGAREVQDRYLTNVFPERPIKSNCYNNFTASELCAVYLIDDVKANHLINKNVLLVGEVGQEVKVLKRLFCGEDYDLDKLYDLQNNFPSWEKLAEDNHFLPLTDLIIVDNYLFNNQDEIVKNNLYKLLELFCSQSHQTKINILIVTQKEFRSNRIINKPDWEQLKDEIANKVKKITEIKPNLTFILTNTQIRKHDRAILTNYRLFRSGDSFCYFNSNGKIITRGDFLDVNSLAKWNNYQVAKSFIESIQRLYDANPQSIITNCQSKKSNFINIENR